MWLQGSECSTARSVFAVQLSGKVTRLGLLLLAPPSQCASPCTAATAGVLASTNRALYFLVPHNISQCASPCTAATAMPTACWRQATATWWWKQTSSPTTTWHW